MARAFRPIPAITERNKRNFFEKISTTPTETGCLEWTANKLPKGYGVFGLTGGNFLAHRIAWFLATGIDPGELLTCHTCDNPPCCNPEHLFLGTAADNSGDKERKGRGNQPTGNRNGSRLHRQRMPRGDNHCHAKLTTEQVILIRADTRFHRVIAADYGIKGPQVCLIKQRKSWAHVP